VSTGLISVPFNKRQSFNDAGKMYSVASYFNISTCIVFPEIPSHFIHILNSVWFLTSRKGTPVIRLPMKRKINLNNMSKFGTYRNNRNQVMHVEK
jgi:hypothetical protein